MSATIVLPSEVFTLERHESYAHERLAYDVIRMAIPALRAARLPDHVSVHLDDGPGATAGHWSFDVSIRPSASTPEEYEIHAASTTPAIILGVCHHFAEGLFEATTRLDWLNHIEMFRSHVIRFGECTRIAARLGQRDGLAAALRAFYGELGLDRPGLTSTANFFDICAQFIANHEVAHAYTRQLSQPRGALNQDDDRAFELVSDLVATEWLYNQMVRNTPDTPEYRRMRGFESHSESILSNTRSVMESQVLVLLILAIASAMDGDGSVSLEGGTSHPHTLVRYSLQQIHFSTLVLSNQTEHVSHGDMERMDATWRDCLSLFVRSGLFHEADVLASLDRSRYADLDRAMDLVDEFDIRELRQAAPHLRELGGKFASMTRRSLQAESTQ